MTDTTTETNPTAEYATQAFAVADFLRTLSEQGLEHIPNPIYDIQSGKITFHVWDSWDWKLSEEQRKDQIIYRVRALAKAIGGRWAKNDPKASEYDDDYYVLTNGHKLADVVEVRIITDRYAMCDRKQVGTKTRVVPAVEAKPETIVEEPVYERECKPLNTRQQQGLDDLVAGEVTA